MQHRKTEGQTRAGQDHVRAPRDQSPVRTRELTVHWAPRGVASRPRVMGSHSAQHSRGELRHSSNHPKRTHGNYCFSNGPLVLGGILSPGPKSRLRFSSASSCVPCQGGVGRPAPHLPLSGGRLSSRHLSCSSPRWILSSSSRCSMRRADFILTKCA